MLALSVALAVLAACGTSEKDRAVDEFSTICTETGIELAEVRPTPERPIRDAAPQLVDVLDRAIERLESIDAPSDVRDDFDLAIQKLVSAGNALDVVARSTSEIAALTQFETAVALAQEAFAVLEPLGVECSSEE